MSDNITRNLNDSQDSKLDRLIAAVQSIDSRLLSLESTVVERLKQTQPIWEAVQVQLAEVKETLERHSEILRQHGEMLERHGEMLERHGEMLERHGEMLKRLDEEVTGLRGEVASLRVDTEKGFRTIDRRMERQIGEFERLHAYQRDLEDRVDRIEKLTNQ